MSFRRLQISPKNNKVFKVSQPLKRGQIKKVPIQIIKCPITHWLLLISSGGIFHTFFYKTVKFCQNIPWVFFCPKDSYGLIHFMPKDSLVLINFHAIRFLGLNQFCAKRFIKLHAICGLQYRLGCIKGSLISEGFSL